MKNLGQCLIAGTFVFALGCTKAVTDFETLDEGNIPRPMFSGTTVLLRTTADASGSESYTISGQCDEKVRAIVASPVGISSVLDILGMTTALNVTCSTNGEFSFTLNSLSSIGFPTPLVLNQSYEIQLRSVTSAGLSLPSLIRITYSTGTGGKQPVLITSGGGRASGGSIRAQVRIHQGIAGVKSGGGIRAHSGVSASAD